MIESRPITPYFVDFVGRAKQILALWAKFVAAVAGYGLIFGMYAPLGVAAALLTLFVPVLLLVMWGRSLDSELNWESRIDGGSW